MSARRRKAEWVATLVASAVIPGAGPLLGSWHADRWYDVKRSGMHTYTVKRRTPNRRARLFG